MIDFLAEAALLVGLLTYARTRDDEPEEAEREAPRQKEARQAPKQAGRPGPGTPRAPERSAPPEPPRERGPAAVLDDAADMAQKAWSRLSGWVGSTIEKSVSGAEAEPERRPRPDEKKPSGTTGRPLWSSRSPYAHASPSGPATTPRDADRSPPRGAAAPNTGRSGPAGARPSPGQPAGASPRPAPPAPPRPATDPARPGATQAARPAASPMVSTPQNGSGASRAAAEPGPASKAASSDAASGAPPSAARPGQPRMVRDPVCGLELPWARAVSLRVGSETLYFCSEACRALYVRRLENG